MSTSFRVSSRTRRTRPTTTAKPSFGKEKERATHGMASRIRSADSLGHNIVTTRLGAGGDPPFGPDPG